MRRLREALDRALNLADECHDKLASVGIEVAAFLDAHPEIQGEWRERLAWRCVGEDLTPFMLDMPDKVQEAREALAAPVDVEGLARRLWGRAVSCALAARAGADMSGVMGVDEAVADFLRHLGVEAGEPTDPAREGE